MATHFWILPWVSLFAFAVAFTTDLFRFRLKPSHPAAPENSSSDVNFDQPISAPKISSWVVLAAATVLAALALLKIGALAGVDFIPLRGLILGVIGGVAIALSRRLVSRQGSWSIDIALAGVVVVIGRLWLTHGETIGLEALVIGLILGVVCLTPISDIAEIAPAAIGATVLAFTVCIGFTRAEDITDSYWADIPLLIASIYSLSLSAAPKSGTTAFRIVVSLITLAAALLLYHIFAKTLAPGAAFVLGLIVSAIQCGLQTSETQPSTQLNTSRVVAAALSLAGVTAAFLLSSGYGIGLFALGGLTVIPVMLGRSSSKLPLSLPLACLAFTAALAEYRLGLLTTGGIVRSSGPGDIWDLVAIGLGLVGVYIGASLLPNYKRLNSTDTWPKIEYVFACIVPVTVLGYLWQPRAFAGLFLGSALAPLLAAAFSQTDEKSTDAQKVVITSLLVGAVLSEILPLLEDAAKPTRTIRVALVLILIVLSIGRALVPVRKPLQSDLAVEEAAA